MKKLLTSTLLGILVCIVGLTGCRQKDGESIEIGAPVTYDNEGRKFVVLKEVKYSRTIHNPYIDQFENRCMVIAKEVNNHRNVASFDTSHRLYAGDTFTIRRGEVYPDK